MRVIIQRVNHASVKVDEQITGSIRCGLLVLAGWEESDTSEDLEWIGSKIAKLRIFADSNGLMNLSVKETEGEILLVSQFTLYAASKKGNRPSFIRSAKPEISAPLYHKFITVLENELAKPVQTGIFGADMKIDLQNDGPVTIYIDSKARE